MEQVLGHVIDGRVLTVSDMFGPDAARRVQKRMLEESAQIGLLFPVRRPPGQRLQHRTRVEKMRRTLWRVAQTIKPDWPAVGQRVAWRPVAFPVMAVARPNGQVALKRDPERCGEIIEDEWYGLGRCRVLLDDGTAAFLTAMDWRSTGRLA